MFDDTCDRPVETQLFYCNSRYYSPELCRWILPDSIEYLDSQSINGLNLYYYCGNNPIMGYDPNGTFDWNNFWETVLGVTAAVGGAKISGLAALGIGAGGAFVAGGLGYTARTLISDSETFELSDMFIEAGANMLSGMMTFAGSVIGGLIGINVPGKFSFKNFALNQMFMGLSGFYLLKYTISLLKKKLQEIY